MTSPLAFQPPSNFYVKAAPRPLSTIDQISINTDLSQDALKAIYWGLGPENKWMECIDGRYHDLGKNVFDLGWHEGAVEPGFIGSMENAFAFIQNHFHTKIDADWYLQLHKLTCAHFKGQEKTSTLISQEGVGVFRTLGHSVFWQARAPDYPFTAEMRAEFEVLNKEYGLGFIIFIDDDTPALISYKEMTSDQVRCIFNKFVTEFYDEIGRATNADEKLEAIAKLHQRLEWLHPVVDGTSRTNIAMMNKLLTEYGFHPPILEYPHRSSCYSRAQWKQYLQDGLLKWEQLREKLKANRGK